MKRIIITIALGILFQPTLWAGVPTWSVNPAGYSNSMSMVGVVRPDGVESLDENDIVAAFINGEVRGVAHLQYEAAVDRYLAYLIIYSNQNSGEVSFKLYDADQDLELDAVGTVNFEVNGLIGNIAEPFIWSDALLNTEAVLESFSFPQSSEMGVIGVDEVDIVVALYSDLTALVADFTASEGADVSVNGIIQTSGTSVNNFESPQVYAVRSQDGNTQNEYFVNITVENLAPSALDLSSITIEENNSNNAALGMLTVTDDDTVHVFTLTSGMGDEDNATFDIIDSELIVRNPLNYEVKNAYSVRVTATDAADQSIAGVFSIEVVDVNEGPTDLDVELPSFSENEVAGTLVATFSTSDPDAGEVFSYTFTGNSVDTVFFEWNGNQLVTAGELNYEVQNAFEFDVRVTDSGGAFLERTVNLSLQDENDEPSQLALDQNSISESAAFGTLIGHFSVTDEDAGDSHQFELVAGPDDTANDLFLISGNQLLLDGSLDFETAPLLSIRVGVEDESGASIERVFEITVLDVNEAPSDLSLSNSMLAEDDSVGFVVGTFSVVDPDPTTMTYSLVDGLNDNALFTIGGAALQLASTLDYEAKSQYVIDVLATDVDDQKVLNRFVIEVSDVNESPTALSVSTTSFGEHTAVGSTIATLSASDPDAGEAFTYSFAGVSSDTTFFEIVEDSLLTASDFNFEDKGSFVFDVAVMDQVGNVFTSTISLNVTDENDVPINLSLNGASVLENAPLGTRVGMLSVSDQDANDTHTYSLISGSGDSDNGQFLISGNQLVADGSFDFETMPSLSIRVRVTDQSGASLEEVFAITIIDINEAPSDLSLSNSTLTENDSVGFVVGTFSVVDADPTTMTYSFADGLNDNGLFEINGATLQLASVLDYEVKAAYVIDVLATDVDDQKILNRFVIEVSDVNESPTELSVSSTSFGEHTAEGSTIATLSASDPDIGEIFTYSFAGVSSDTSFFEIAEDRLLTTSKFNYEEKSNFEFAISVMDVAGNVLTSFISLNVTDQNDAPINLSLNGSVALENAPVGTRIGTLSVSDEDVNDTHTYSLVSGSGDADNGQFLISGNQLVVDGSFDFETAPSLSIRLGVSDESGAAIEEVFTITILDTNEAPSDLSLSNKNLSEDDSVGFVVGTFSVVDADPTEMTYSLVDGLNDNALFTIDGAALQLATTLDYEVKSQYVIDVLATDVDDQKVLNRFVIEVTDINESPVSVSLSTTSFGEHTAVGSTIATLSASDPDIGETFIYSFAGVSSDTSFFEIAEDRLLTASDFNFEENSNFEFAISVMDVAGNVLTSFISLNVTDENDRPADLSLDGLSIIENSPFGTKIGNLSVIDEDVDDVHTYTLVPGDGDTDNHLVLISDSELLVRGNIDFEMNPQISVRIKVSDGSGGSTEKAFIVDVIDTNDAVPSFSLSNGSLEENLPAGSLVGEILLSNIDSTGLSYELVGEINDNDFFTIVNRQILTSSSLDFEAQNRYVLEVRVFNSNGFEIIKRLVVQVNDLNEAPEEFRFELASFKEHLPPGSVVGRLFVTDPDNGDLPTYSFIGTSSDTSSFMLDGDQLKTVGTFNYELKSNYSLEIKVTDQAGNELIESFNLELSDENDAPTDLFIDNISIEENALPTSLVGHFSVLDEDGADAHTFALVNGEGDSDNGLVIISDRQLLTKTSLNFESQSFLSIRVKVTDAVSASYEKVFIIDVLDVNDAPGALQFSTDTIDENLAIGQRIGSFNVIDEDLTAMTYAFIEDFNDNGYFEIDGDSLVLKKAMNYEEKDVFFIDVLGTDVDNQTIANRFTLRLNDVNEAPIVVNDILPVLKDRDETVEISVAEVFMDPDADDELTLTLVSGDGALLPEGVDFNPEQKTVTFNQFLQAKRHVFKLIATDKEGLSIEHEFEVTVNPIVTGVEANDQQYQIYPNPVQSKLHLKMKSGETGRRLGFAVYSLSGSLLIRSVWSGSLDVNHLKSGIYLLELTDGLAVHRMKFIKK